MSQYQSTIATLLVALTLLASFARSARADAPLPAAVAKFELTRGRQRERLEVVRTASRVEHRYLDRGVTSVWKRSPSGELEHWKVFASRGRAVHYTAGDLRTVHIHADWEELSTLLAPAERAMQGPRRASKDARRLRTDAAQRPRRVVWDEERAWPREIVVQSGKRRTRFLLRSSEACSGELCSETDLTSVRETEFADLGDSEHDPFVRWFLAEFSEHVH